MFRYRFSEDGVVDLPSHVGQAMAVIQKMTNRGHQVGVVTFGEESFVFGTETPSFLDGQWRNLNMWMSSIKDQHGLSYRRSARAELLIAQIIDLTIDVHPDNFPHVYCDQDGVLAAYDVGYPLIFDVHQRADSEELMWERVFAHPNFFELLPVEEGADELFEAMTWLNHSILTACPHSNYVAAARQKRAWFKLNYPDFERPILPVVGGTNKCVMMHKPGDILIDDWGKNIEAWEAAGGVGILHDHTNIESTLERLLAALTKHAEIYHAA